MKGTDAIPQRGADPSRPIARERGCPSLTRTDIKEGNWGNCSNKSSVCSCLGFLHSARGAGCVGQLCFCSALTPSLRTASTAFTPFRWVHGGKGASTRAETSEQAPRPFSSFLPEQGMETQVHCPIPKTILLPSPLNSNFCHYPSLGFTCTVYSPYLKYNSAKHTSVLFYKGGNITFSLN